MKKILKYVAILAGVVLLAILTLPIWIGPVACGVVNIVAPRIVGVEVHLGEFGLNPYTGTLRVGDFQLHNPEGYVQKMAFTLGHLTVRVDPLSVLSSTLRVRELRVQDVFVSYIGTENAGLTGKMNYDIILENALGPAEPKNAAKQQPAAAKQQPAAAKTAEKGSDRKLIVDLISAKGVLVQYGPLTTPVPVPDIKGIGVSSGGVSVETAYAEVSKQVLNSFGSAGKSLSNLGSIGFDKSKDGLRTGAQKVGAATDALLDKAKDLKGVSNSLKGLFK